MAQNDNLYGAPTSGLGGTIDFGQQTPDLGGIPADDTGVPQRTSVQTINANAVNPLPAVDIDTAGLIGTMQDKLLRPQLDQLRMSRMLSGMQQAQAGVTIEQIDKATPWYTKVFEGNDAVVGARVYKVDEAVQRAVLDAEQDMPNLRAKSTEEVHGLLMEKAKSHMTGDPETDLQVTEAFGRHLPGLLDKHVRERIAYQQLEAATSLQRANGVTLDRMENLLAGGDADYDKLPEKEKMAQVAELTRQLAPPPGMENSKDWQNRTAGLLAAQARAGDLQAVGLLRSSGWVEAHLGANPDAVIRIERAVDQGHAKVKATYGAEFASSLAELRVLAENNAEVNRGRAAKNLPPVGGAELQGMVNALNAKWAKRTGDESPLISGEETASLLHKHIMGAAHHSAALRAEDERQARQAAQEQAAREREERAAGNKEEAALAKQRRADVAMADVYNPRAFQDMAPHDVQSAATRVIDSLRSKGGDTLPFLKAMAITHNLKVKSVDDELAGKVNAAKSGDLDAFTSLVDTYAALRKGGESAIIGMYLDEPIRHKLDDVLSARVGSADPTQSKVLDAQIYKSVFLAPDAPAKVTGKDAAVQAAGLLQGVQAAVPEGRYGTGTLGFGARPLTEQQANFLGRFTAHEKSQEGVAAALGARITNGEVELVGPVAVGRFGAPSVVATVQGMFPAGRVSVGEVHDVARDVIGQHVNGSGIVTVQSATLQTVNGQGALVVAGPNEHGQQRWTVVQYSDIAAPIRARREQAAKDAEQDRANSVPVQRQAMLDKAAADWKAKGVWYRRNGAEPPVRYDREPKLSDF